VLDRYEKEGFQREVAANFKALMAKDHVVKHKDEATPTPPEGSDSNSKTPWHVVDASRTVGVMVAYESKHCTYACVGLILFFV